MTRPRRTPDRLCEADHDPTSPRTAYPGLRVCTTHRHRASKALAALPDLYDELADYLRTRGLTETTGRITVTPDPGLTLDQRTIDARTEIADGLREWVAWALKPRPATHRPATGPITIITRSPWAVRPPTDTPRALCAWITPRLDWYLATGEAAAFTAFLLDAYTAGRRRRQPNPARREELHVPCPEPDCPGSLWATIRPADDLLPAAVICDAAPIDEATGKPIHTWPSRDFLLLGRKVTGREPQPGRQEPTA